MFHINLSALVVDMGLRRHVRRDVVRIPHGFSTNRQCRRCFTINAAEVLSVLPIFVLLGGQDTLAVFQDSDLMLPVVDVDLPALVVYRPVCSLVIFMGGGHRLSYGSYNALCLLHFFCISRSRII